MENVAKVSSKNILRIYDIKGSSYDRQVIKKENLSNLTKSKIEQLKNTKVLKDLDFLTEEKQLFIDDKIKTPLLK